MNEQYHMEDVLYTLPHVRDGTYCTLDLSLSPYESIFVIFCVNGTDAVAPLPREYAESMEVSGSWSVSLSAYDARSVFSPFKAMDGPTNLASPGWLPDFSASCAMRRTLNAAKSLNVAGSVWIWAKRMRLRSFG